MIESIAHHVTHMDNCMHTSEFVSMDQWMEGKSGKIVNDCWTKELIQMRRVYILTPASVSAYLNQIITHTYNYNQLCILYIIYPYNVRVHPPADACFKDSIRRLCLFSRFSFAFFALTVNCV